MTKIMEECWVCGKDTNDIVADSYGAFRPMCKKCQNAKTDSAKKRYITNITWETDGVNIDLPTEVEIPVGVANCDCGDTYCGDNEQSVNDYLSDTYGWLTLNWEIIEK